MVRERSSRAEMEPRLSLVLIEDRFRDGEKVSARDPGLAYWSGVAITLRRSRDIDDTPRSTVLYVRKRILGVQGARKEINQIHIRDYKQPSDDQRRSKESCFRQVVAQFT